ncbi:MAG: RNA methyltransferase [Chitinispirillales bacterium]|nr:RNA methyltransferase [Chitinispirillales bacterium]
MRDGEHYLFYGNAIIRDVSGVNDINTAGGGDTEAAEIILDGSESNHAVSVLRIKVGQPIQVADGYGVIYNCQCSDIRKQSVSCKIIDKRQISRIIPEITLLIGLPDKERFETILEHAAALGVSRIIPIAADHCRKPWWEGWDGLRRRFLSKMVVSMKQSLYPYVPLLDAPMPLREAVAGCLEALMVADRDGKCLSDAEILRHKRINCLVGPPGGISGDEKELLESYTAIPVTTVKIASTRLRSELAATVLCSRIIAAHLR